MRIVFSVHVMAGVWYFMWFKSLDFHNAIFQIINSLSAVGVSAFTFWSLRVGGGVCGWTSMRIVFSVHVMAGVWYFMWFKGLDFHNAIFQIINSLSAVGVSAF